MNDNEMTDDAETAGQVFASEIEGDLGYAFEEFTRYVFGEI